MGIKYKSAAQFIKTNITDLRTNHISGNRLIGPTDPHGYLKAIHWYQSTLTLWNKRWVSNIYRLLSSLKEITDMCTNHISGNRLIGPANPHSYLKAIHWYQSTLTLWNNRWVLQIYIGCSVHNKIIKKQITDLCTNHISRMHNSAMTFCYTSPYRQAHDT